MSSHRGVERADEASQTTSVDGSADAARLRSLLELLPVPIVACAPMRDGSAITDLRFTFLNRAACRVFGRPPQDLVGRGLLDLLPGSMSVGAFDFCVDSLTSGEPRRQRFPPVRIGDFEGSFELSTAVLGDELMVVAHDITALLAVEQRRQAILQSMLDPHVLMQAERDEAGKIVDFVYADVNAAACDYMQMPAERLVGRRLLEILPGQARTGMLDLYATAVESGEPLVLDDYSYPHEILQDERRYDIRAVRVGDALSFTWRDVTDRHRQTRALAESQARYRLMAENASDVVARATPDGTIEWISASVTTLLGWRPDDLVGHMIFEYLHPDDMPALMAAQSRIAHGEPLNFEGRVRRADGDYRWVASHVRPLVDENGVVTGRVAGWRDIHEQRQAAAALADSENLFRTAMDHSAVGMCLVAPGGAFLRVNAALCRMLDRDADDLMAATWQDITHPDDLQEDEELVADVLRGVRDNYRLRKRYLRPNGDIVWGDLSVSCVRNPDGTVHNFISQITDVTDMHEAMVAVAASEEQFRLLAENASDALVHSRGGLMVWLSPSLTQVLGWAPKDWAGHRFEEFAHPDDVALARGHHAEISPGTTRITRLRLRDIAGDFHWVEVHASPFIGSDGVPDGIVASFRTIDAQIMAEGVLKNRARYDELTGLLNRAEVFEQLGLLLSQTPRTGQDIAVAFCDLDSFKEINDTFGHQMGDHVLRTVARDIVALLRSDDLIARIGGDEILLVLTGVHGLESAADVAEKVRLAAGKERRYRDITYSPKLSIGVTLLRRDEEPDDAIARADRAMYAAKRAGGNHVFTA